MKIYKEMTRRQIIEKIIDFRVEDSKKRNFEKFGNNDLPRINENRQCWYNLYKTYPMQSNKYPEFSLIGIYERFYA